MDALFSKSVKAGDRTYFIDVKEAKNKAKYLTIAESKPSKNGDKKFSRSSVMVFDSKVAEFQEALVEAFSQMK
jgi:3-hydroxymyristoyl/3-hydroxydecanoyl-(acyl carrier protein) dehydratase